VKPSDERTPKSPLVASLIDAPTNAGAVLNCFNRTRWCVSTGNAMTEVATERGSIARPGPE
jgi:hypothetical protein